jgi:probable F420-dependent oxidoreductase
LASWSSTPDSFETEKNLSNTKELVMKIGVSVPLTEKSGNPGEIAREAENLGLESFWVVEHMAVPIGYKTVYPRSRDGKVPDMYARLIDPFVALAIAAQTTSRIKLGTGICLLPQHNVIEMAKITASIDLYSNGRLILGVGAGWFAEEAELMGVDFKRRWQHLREAVEALRVLWTKDEASYSGEIIKFPAIRLGPKPVQKGGPRVILGAHDPRYALKRVARYADGWMPGGLSPAKARECIPEIRKMAKEHGRDPEALEFSVFLASAKPEEPSTDTIKEYRDAGITRLAFMVPGAADHSGIEEVRKLAPIVERASKV